MRIVLKALLVLAASAVVMLTVCLCWFFFYSGDLPSFAEVAKFAPDSPTTVSSLCFGSPVHVIPTTLVGKNLQNAARAAEGNNDEVLARQISFDLFCNSQARMLKRHLLEYKASVQIRRRFTPDQLLTIYLNRAYFGNDLMGVESASLHYYGKAASELDVPQAALIAGLIKAPSIYSPERHPDRAKERRDLVIQGMLRNGSITAQQAQAAEQTALR
ncbi:MAG TPA: transglycosylase domain-containing protein [Candidatus Sulfotelmatobacter sp.]|nr:transglycosylase domain-containing protein [Candidatus Sulfotelmatobacter sp.]